MILSNDALIQKVTSGDLTVLAHAVALEETGVDRAASRDVPVPGSVDGCSKGTDRWSSKKRVFVCCCVGFADAERWINMR